MASNQNFNKSNFYPYRIRQTSSDGHLITLTRRWVSNFSFFAHTCFFLFASRRFLLHFRLTWRRRLRRRRCFRRRRCPDRRRFRRMTRHFRFLALLLLLLQQLLLLVFHFADAPDRQLVRGELRWSGFLLFQTLIDHLDGRRDLLLAVSVEQLAMASLALLHLLQIL